MALSSGAYALIAAVVSAAATTYSAVSSNKQAEKANKRNLAYQKELAQQEADAQAKEQQLALEAIQRERAYGASLLNADSLLSNATYVGEENDSYGVLGNTLGSGQTPDMMTSTQQKGVDSMFA